MNNVFLDTNIIIDFLDEKRTNHPLAVNFNKDVIEKAIDFSLKNSKDFEDVLQCLTAKKYNCTVITNDKKFADCGVEILNYKNAILI
jgi:predicted nucleic acid-binding protein